MPVMVFPAAELLTVAPPVQLKAVPLPNGLAHVPSTVTGVLALLLVLLVSERGTDTWLVSTPTAAPRTTYE
jgi:hypothetical protein